MVSHPLRGEDVVDDDCAETDSFDFVLLSRLKVHCIGVLLELAFFCHTFVERSSRRLALIIDKGFCVHSTAAMEGDADFMSENKLRSSK